MGEMIEPTIYIVVYQNDDEADTILDATIDRETARSTWRRFRELARENADAYEEWEGVHNAEWAQYGKSDDYSYYDRPYPEVRNPEDVFILSKGSDGMWGSIELGASEPVDG